MTTKRAVIHRFITFMKEKYPLDKSWPNDEMILPRQRPKRVFSATASSTQLHPENEDTNNPVPPTLGGNDLENLSDMPERPIQKVPNEIGDTLTKDEVFRLRQLLTKHQEPDDDFLDVIKRFRNNEAE
jgi:hypothetical protein